MNLRTTLFLEVPKQKHVSVIRILPAVTLLAVPFLTQSYTIDIRIRAVPHQFDVREVNVYIFSTFKQIFEIVDVLFLILFAVYHFLLYVL